MQLANSKLYGTLFKWCYIIKSKVSVPGLIHNGTSDSELGNKQQITSI